MTLCACSHGEDSHHPAGRCAAVLPADAAAELPAWTCPCRRFIASGVTTRLLATVQSCTVLAPPRAPDPCVCPDWCPEHPYSVLRTAQLTSWVW